MVGHASRRVPAQCRNKKAPEGCSGGFFVKCNQGQAGSALVVVTIAPGERRAGFESFARGTLAAVVEAPAALAAVSPVATVLETTVATLKTTALAAILVPAPAALVADDPGDGPEG